VNHGLVIADGTPLELKETSRSARLEVTLSAPHADAVSAMAPLVAGTVHVSDDGRRLVAGVDASTGLATAVVRALDAAGVLVDNIEVRQPSLDDVFFTLTGEHVVEEDEVVDPKDDDGSSQVGERLQDSAGDGVGSEVGSSLDDDEWQELEGARR
jgi:ABC-2 type transport system ATP-binding protein